jgi:two-component sensor histidine kinase/ribosomal protein S17E
MRLLVSVGALLLLFGLSGQTKASLIQITKEGSLQEQFDAHIKLFGLYDFDHVDSALISGLELVRIAEELDDNTLLGDAHKFLSIGYRGAGLFDQALVSSYIAIDYYEKANTEDKSGKIADIYHNMAWVFTFQEDYSKTASYFHKSIRLRTSGNRKDSVSLANSYTALGSFYYIYEPLYDSSEYYFLKAIDYMERLGIRREVIARAEAELANAYLFDKKFENADQLLKRLKNYHSDSVSGYIKIYITYLEGLEHHQKENYAEALALFEPVYDWLIASGNQHNETGINGLRKMIETAEKGGFYEKAYGYLSLLRQIERESIYKDRQRTTKALEIVNETKRKEQLIELQQDQISLQTQIITISLVGMGVILTLSLFLIRSRNKVKAKNDKIEMLMRELHHRVKNNLQVISSLLGLQSIKLQDAVAKQAVSEGKQRIKAMSLIHQKLYQQDEVSALNIEEYITALVNDLADSFGFRAKGEVRIEVPSMTLNADTSLPLGLIINELVTNALKYAYLDIEKPVLELKLITEEKHRFTLHIRDNGRGLPADFDLATAESFGLKLVNILIRQIDGTIRHEQRDGLEYMISFQSV